MTPADARTALLDFLDAQSTSLTHALRLTADADDAKADEVAANIRPVQTAAIAMLRESAVSRRTLADRLDTLVNDLWEAENPAAVAGAPDSPSDPELYQQARAAVAEAKASADEASDRLRASRTALEEIGARLARPDHAHVAADDGVTCTVCGERREYRYAGGAHRYAWLSEAAAR